ncbi:hypothetical protein D3C87_871350 [compost metagenome]
MRERLVDAIYQDDLHGAQDLVGDVLEVGLVAPGEDDGGDAGATGGEDLFLDAADGKDLAAQGHLTGHGDGGADLASGDEGGDRRRDGDAC